MKTLSLWQPWASLLTLRPPCVRCFDTGRMGVTYPTDYGTGFEHDEIDCDACPLPVKWIETRSWRAPESLLGERLAFHAAKRPPEEGLDLAGHVVHRNMLSEPMLSLPEAYEDVGEGGLHAIPLPLGCVVGSGRLVDCLPMIEGQVIQVPNHDVLHITRVPDPHLPMNPWSSVPTLTILRHADLFDYSEIDHEDVTDQMPYGHFEAGRFAWLFEDQATVWQRCPDCWGDASTVCHLCHGVGRLEEPPVVVGRQGVFNWIVPDPDAVDDRLDT